MINKFAKEVSDKLQYYVYRLVDPRTGLTFYVGKGKGNRVFSHAAGAIRFSKTPDSEDELHPQNTRTIRNITIWNDLFIFREFCR